MEDCNFEDQNVTLISHETKSKQNLLCLGFQLHGYVLRLIMLPIYVQWVRLHRRQYSYIHLADWSSKPVLFDKYPNLIS